jgi:S-adenosylmethionine synthetase
MATLFTSESVTEGHPDKICDRIADSILDAILEKDKSARVACEVAVTKGLVHIMGEINTNCYVEIEKIVRQTILSIGYNKVECGFDGNSCGIIISIGSQSKDIALGVENSLESKLGNGVNELGAGDQGIMFGYACRETPEFMPLPIMLAHKAAKRLSEVRKNETLKYLRPDGKVQVTVAYENGKPKCVNTVVISAQHSEEISQKKVHADLTEAVIGPIFGKPEKIFINPTGRFTIGGPAGDTGITGRKLMVDTYGGYSRHGGGAFSGKDATKVDRSAAYMARYVAKNIVAAEIAEKCEVQLAYAIGVAQPVSVFVETFGTSRFDNAKISSAIKNVFDFRPSAIIKKFLLDFPIYAMLSAYGHMGREDLGVLWEQTDKIRELKEILR